MDLPEIGGLAPDFSLLNQSGEKVELKSLRGTHVLLWWFPMADTPG